MNTKHTPEPWTTLSLPHPVYGSDGRVMDDGIGIGSGSQFIGAMSGKHKSANAARIVACVNACAGMEDPARHIEADRARMEEIADACDRLRAEVARLREALSECVTDDGAHCLVYGTDTPKLRARIAAINSTARAALSETK